MKSTKNIVLLCPDEMKATALGCYGQTQPVSPFIDKLAERSFVFEQCHTVHPKCSPSRAALVTAQYPHVGGHRTLDLFVRPHEVNLVTYLRSCGYDTALVGKNHTADDKTFSKMFAYHKFDGGSQSMEDPARKMVPGSYFVGQDKEPLENFRDHVNTSNALQWMDDIRDPEKPFFLWLNWNAPHPPYTTPAPFYGRLDRSKIELPPRDDPRGKAPYQRELAQSYDTAHIDDAGWREIIATYLEMTSFVDAEVERVYRYLEDKGLLEDTLIVIWSDHGDFAGEHQLPEKWDTSFYDCITRVPFIVFDPSRGEGKRLPALVESIDIMPTLLDWVGVEIPKGIQGLSLAPLMRGEIDSLRDVVFCQGGQEPEMFDRVVAPDAKPRPCMAYQLKQEAFYRNPEINIRAKMIRDTRWKYIYHLNDFEELYDLESDPWEIENLASRREHADTLTKYRMRMMKKLVEAESVDPYQDYVES